MGSRSSFSSSSSMSATFHFRRCTCHVPSANVKIGIMPIRTMVGVINGSRLALYVCELPSVVSMRFEGRVTFRRREDAPTRGRVREDAKERSMTRSTQRV